MKLNWVPVARGRMSVGHRPKLRAIPYFPQEGCTCVVTLLSAKEEAEGIGALVRESGMRWIWIPLAGGNPPGSIPPGLDEIAEVLSAGFSVFVHCSAGMHRTGMIAFALLRRLGYTEKQSLELIQTMRIETRTALTQKHIDWGNAIV